MKNKKKMEKTSLNVIFFEWDQLHLTALKKETYFSGFDDNFIYHPSFLTVPLCVCFLYIKRPIDYEVTNHSLVPMAEQFRA